MDLVAVYGAFGWLKIILVFQAYTLVYVLAQSVVGQVLGLAIREVALGFGPRMLGVRWGETEYRLCWILLGGYTRFHGEEGEEATDRSFSRLAGAQKVFLLSAGPQSSVVVGILVFAALYFSGRQEPRFLEEPARIGWCRPSSAFQRAQLKPGDVVVSVGYGGPTVQVRSWRAFLQVLSRAYGRPLRLECQRGSERVVLEVPASPAPVSDVSHSTAVTWQEAGLREASAPVRIIRLGPGAAMGRAVGDAVEALNVLWRWVCRQGEFIPRRRGAQDNGYAGLVAHLYAAEPDRFKVFIGLLGIALGLLNLLPLGGLNGGVIGITALETLLGRQLSLFAMEAFFKLGALISLPLLAYLLYLVAAGFRSAG